MSSARPARRGPRIASERRAEPRARERLTGEVRREQILAAGRELFLERPYEDVSTDDIASRANVSKGLVFFYFGSKRELYVELVREAAEELLAATQTPPDRPPLDRLRAGLDAYLDYVEKNAAAYASLMGGGGVGLDPELARIVERTRATLAQRLLEGFPKELSTPLLAVLARGFVGFVEGATLAWIERRTPPREVLLDTFVTVLMRTALEGAPLKG